MFSVPSTVVVPGPVGAAAATEAPDIIKIRTAERVVVTRAYSGRGGFLRAMIYDLRADFCSPPPRCTTSKRILYTDAEETTLRRYRLKGLDLYSRNDYYYY